MRVPSFFYLTPTSSHPLALPVGLDWWHSPLSVPDGGFMLFFPSSTICFCLSLPVFRAVSWCLLKFFWCSFAQRLEAWAPQIPGDHLPNPSPPCYSSISALFRLPPLTPCRHDPIPVGRISVGRYVFNGRRFCIISNMID